MWPFNRRKKQREFVRELGKRYPFTPDMVELEQASHRLLFVCDDMMVPHKNYPLIKDRSVKVSRGFTQDRFDFRVGRHTGKALPMMAKDGLRVKGELHAVESYHFDALDRYYQNGVEFARVKVKVILTNRDHELIHIGDERFLKKLPPGVIRTVPELGLRHYISNPHINLVTARMYVAIKSFWCQDHEDETNKDFPIIQPKFPAEPVLWLPRYYKYPIERNRCLK